MTVQGNRDVIEDAEEGGYSGMVGLVCGLQGIEKAISGEIGC